jgi:hypothetical protein
MGEFHLFNRLPFELRRMIWASSIPKDEPEFYEAEPANTLEEGPIDEFRYGLPVPPIAHVCQESRQVALEEMEWEAVDDWVPAGAVPGPDDVRLENGRYQRTLMLPCRRMRPEFDIFTTVAHCGSIHEFAARCEDADYWFREISARRVALGIRNGSDVFQCVRVMRSCPDLQDLILGVSNSLTAHILRQRENSMPVHYLTYDAERTKVMLPSDAQLLMAQARFTGWRGGGIFPNLERYLMEVLGFARSGYLPRHDLVDPKSSLIRVRIVSIPSERGERPAAEPGRSLIRILGTV